MEEEALLQDTQTPDETLDELGTIIENGELGADKLAETNKRLYARAKKAEEELKNLRGAKHEEKPQEVKHADLSTREVLELRAEGYDDKEILSLAEEASKLKVSISTLTKNETFKKGLETLRKEARATATTPPTSQRVAGFSFKGKNYSDLKTDAERREAFNAMRSGNSRSNE